jgi:aminoglycoside phosphotransferase (APT) family kinase protein
MYAEFAANDRAALAPAKPSSRRSRAALAKGLAAWFEERGHDGSPRVEVERPQPGLSSDTILLDVDGESYVARLPPLSAGLFPDYDLARQDRVQRAVGAAGIPSAVPIAYETDLSWVGAPFLVMPRIPGRTLTTNPSYLTHGWLAESSAGDQTAMFRRFVNMLGRIHRLDHTELDLGTLSGGGPTLSGVLDYWDRYLDWATEGGNAELVEGAKIYRDALSWCRANLPASPPPAGLLWGDPQLQNLVVDDSGEIAAVLDWEMAGLGVPELDLSWFLVLHEHAAETAGHDLPGFPGRDTIVGWYAEALGREVADLHWYDVLANIRSGAIVLRIGGLLAAAGHPTTWTSQVPQPRHLANLIAVNGVRT